MRAFSRFDVDGDGKVMKSEFLGNASKVVFADVKAYLRALDDFNF